LSIARRGVLNERWINSEKEYGDWKIKWRDCKSDKKINLSLDK